MHNQKIIRTFVPSKTSIEYGDEYAEKLRQRNSTFAHFAKVKDALHTVLVTTYGLAPNIHSGSIYSTVTMDELFAEFTKV